jgi:type II secretory pathway component PulF
MSNLRLTGKEKLSIITNLATMLTAGIPLLETIDSLLKNVKGNQKKVLIQLEKDVQEGLPISESFAKSPKAFDPITINLIRAAEESGNLETTLTDLAENIRKEIEFSGKVKSAMMYPMFIVLLFLGVMVVILTYVMPRISQVFSRLKVNIPLPTRILMSVSDFFVAHTLAIVIGTFVFIVLSIFIYTWKKREIIGIITSLPVISKLARIIDLSKVTRSMSLLLASGVPIVTSLGYAAEVVSKKSMRDAILKAQNLVEGGRDLSQGLLASKKQFPDLMIRIIEAGERSGSLEKSMQNLAHQFEHRVETTLKSITTILEPVMLVVVGLMVGGIMLAIIAPIYQMIGNITPR